jgi:hypothetical protein
MADARKVSFCGQEGYVTGFQHLMDTLGEYVGSHDHDLALDAAAAQTDLTTGTAVAGWLAEAVFVPRNSEPLYPPPLPAMSSPPEHNPGPVIRRPCGFPQYAL